MLHYLGVGWGPILQRGHRASVTCLADTIQGPAQPPADTSAVCHPQADASAPPPSALARAVILPAEAVEDVFDDEEYLAMSDITEEHELNTAADLDEEEILVQDVIIADNDEDESTYPTAGSVNLEIEWEPAVSILHAITLIRC